MCFIKKLEAGRTFNNMGTSQWNPFISVLHERHYNSQLRLSSFTKNHGESLLKILVSPYFSFSFQFLKIFR